MTLRRRGYLIEATYRRDKEYRNIAIDFFKSLRRFLEKRSDELKPLNNGGFSVYASLFWRNPLAKSLAVVFHPYDRHKTGGLGTAGHLDVLVFSILNGVGDKSRMIERLDTYKDVVIHEVIHFLDKQRQGDNERGVERYSRKGGDEIDYDVYYNDPSEWNAFWQEGARKYEFFLTQSRGRNNQNFKNFLIGNGSLSQAREQGARFAWDKDFLANMNKKTERKFDKRFAELWRVLKKKGVV